MALLWWGEVLPTFSSNVLPSPTNCLTPRSISLSETFLIYSASGKGSHPRPLWLPKISQVHPVMFRKHPFCCLARHGTRRNDNRRTIDHAGFVQLRCDLQIGHNQVFGHQSCSPFTHSKLSLQPACQNSIKCFTQYSWDQSVSSCHNSKSFLEIHRVSKFILAYVKLSLWYPQTFLKLKLPI